MNKLKKNGKKLINNSSMRDKKETLIRNEQKKKQKHD